MPAAMPLTVTISAVRTRGSGCSRTRRSSSTCTRLIGSTYGLRTSIERRRPGSTRAAPVAGDVEHARDRARQPRAQLRAERLQVVRHQLPVVLGGDAAVGLGQHHLDQVDRRLEVRPLAVHLAQLIALAARDGARRARPRRRARRRASAASGSRRTATGSRAGSTTLDAAARAAPAGCRCSARRARLPAWPRGSSRGTAGRS